MSEDVLRPAEPWGKFQERLEKAGVYDEFWAAYLQALRDAEKREGRRLDKGERAIIRAGMMDKYPPSVAPPVSPAQSGKRGSSSKSDDSTQGASGVDRAIERLTEKVPADRKCTTKREIEWVVQNATMPLGKIELDSIPSRGALYWLGVAKKDHVKFASLCAPVLTPLRAKTDEDEKRKTRSEDVDSGLSEVLSALDDRDSVVSAGSEDIA